MPKPEGSLHWRFMSRSVKINVIFDNLIFINEWHKQKMALLSFVPFRLPAFPALEPVRKAASAGSLESSF